VKKVSIIVTVYNVEKYLEKCLNSLVNQTLDNIEIIIVNDGSPDNSFKMIKEYSKKYPKIIKEYTIENSGLGEARNYGLDKCNGKYIMYVDSDDYIEKNMAEDLYNLAEKENSDVVICGYNVINEDTNEIIKHETAYSPIEPTNFLYSLLFGKTAVWNKLYKKELIQNNKIKYRSRVWYEDVDFSFKVYTKSKKVSFINKSYYNYLIRSGSIMNNDNLERTSELCQSFDEVIKYSKENKVYEKYQKEIEFYCLFHMYICGITRIINTNNRMSYKKRKINEYRKYLAENFPDYRKNIYLPKLPRSNKMLYYLINLKFYYTIKIIFKLKSN